MTHKPSYGPARGVICIQQQTIETTQPGDAWESHRSTGKRRARLFRWVPVPLRVAWTLIYWVGDWRAWRRARQRA